MFWFYKVLYDFYITIILHRDHSFFFSHNFHLGKVSKTKLKCCLLVYGKPSYHPKASEVLVSFLAK